MENFPTRRRHRFFRDIFNFASHYSHWQKISRRQRSNWEIKSDFLPDRKISVRDIDKFQERATLRKYRFIEISRCVFVRWVTVALYVFITDLAYIVRSVRTNTFEAGARVKEPGEEWKRERYFRRRGNFHRFSPPRQRFSSTSYTPDISYLPTYHHYHRRHGQDDAKFPLWKSTFVRQVQASARSFLHVCQRGTPKHFRSHAPIAPETR